MLSLLKKLFAKKAEAIPAPWPFPTGTTKIDAPADEPAVATSEPAKCGCGRSPSGLCVGLHALSTEEWAINDANPAKVVAETAAVVDGHGDVHEVAVETKTKKAVKPKVPAKATPRKPRAKKTQ